MIRGTTEVFTFHIPCTKGELEWATAKFWQQNNPEFWQFSNPDNLLPITKTLEDCGNPNDSLEVCVSLTAEETARFSDRYKGMVQFRAKYRGNDVIFASHKKEFTVYPMYEGLLEEIEQGK